MDELAEYDRLVNLIYDIPLAPERLPAVLEQVTRWLEGDTCHLVGWNGASQVPLLSISVGLDEGIGPDYAAHYATIDPRRRFALDQQAPGQLLACHEHFDTGFVLRSEFFQDYLLPMGIHYMLGTTLMSDASHLVQIAFQRYVGHSYFSAREMQWAERLMPHLRRAMALLLQGEGLRQGAGLAAAGLQASSLALIAVDDAGRPVYANRQAEALLRRGDVLTLKDGVLRAPCLDQDAALSSMVRAAARNRVAGNLMLETLPGCAASTRFSLTCVPAPQSPVFGHSAAALCLIVPLGARRVATVSQLMQLFGLSPAEARLLRALAQGTTPDCYARECGVRPSTVKSQLKSLFAKTGARRQVDLVRLTTDIPVVRD